MKKNLIIGLLLVIYTGVFLFLFIQLRGMSAAVMEELAEKNVYYSLGLMYMAGVSVAMYLLMEGNSVRNLLTLEKEKSTDSFSFDETETETVETVQSNSKLETIKSDMLSVFERYSNEKDRLDQVIVKLGTHFEISQALVYCKVSGQLTLQSSYAVVLTENDAKYIATGEGLTGQAVLDKKPFIIKDVPEGYMKVYSGLGESLPKTLLIIPCVKNEDVKCLFELSSLKDYSQSTIEEIVAICNYVTELLNQ